MLYALRTRLAESMIETIISITVIALSSVATLSMLQTALKGNNVIGEKLVAIELAMEGLDAVKSIRDTNYLLFASDPENCWDKLNLTSTSVCSSATSLGNREYYLQQDFSTDPMYRWTMTPVGSVARNGYLNLFDLAISTTESIPYYSDWHNASNSAFTTDETNQFFRTVTIDRDPVDSSGTALCADSQCYQATVTVEWTIADLTQSVSLSRLITNVY